jgi:hypothetical protein
MLNDVRMQSYVDEFVGPSKNKSRLSMHGSASGESLPPEEKECDIVACPSSYFKRKASNDPGHVCAKKLTAETQPNVTPELIKHAIVVASQD